MYKTTKTQIGLYGALVNLALVIFNVFLIVIKVNQLPLSFIVTSSVLLLISSFLIYYFIASYYSRRRKSIDGIVLFDIMFAIILEALIIASACTLYGFISAIGAITENGKDLINGFFSIIIVSALWIVAAFGLQLITLGILSGILGWYLLKKRTS